LLSFLTFRIIFCELIGYTTMNDDRNDSKIIFGQFTFCTFLIRIQFLFYKKIALRQDGKMRY